MKNKEFKQLIRTITKDSELKLMEEMIKNKRQKKIFDQIKNISLYCLKVK